MSTQIKRLQQSGSAFVPITLSEAVVVNCTDLPGLSSYGITTLERVLRAYLGIMGTNAGDIVELEKQINYLLNNKQDILKAGDGIEILPDGTIRATFSTTLYEVVTDLPSASSECLNKIYIKIIRNGTSAIRDVCEEYICVEQNGNYFWERIGTLQTEVNLDNYISKDIFNSFVSYVDTTFITAIDVTSSEATGSIPITLDYEIPDTLHDYLL